LYNKPTEVNPNIQATRYYRKPFKKKPKNIKKPLDPKKAKDDQLYDADLKAVIVDYQKKFDLNEDGVIGQKTISVLNTSMSDIEMVIKTNMDRYRWLSDNLPEKRIEINIPSFTLTAYEKGKVISSRATIVGRAEKKTALMETNLYGVVLNPFWHVPRTYATQQLLPILRTDKRYLIDQEFEVLKMEKEGWRSIDPLSIDWDKVNETNYNYLLRQRAGRKNVLGAIKFNILNTYDIYLHSTTEPWLFTSKNKAFSSGCIRVEKPDELAKWMLKNNTTFDMNKFDDIYHAYDNEDPNVKKQNMVSVPLTKPLPTYITYFTVKVDEEGNLKFYDDLYKWDSGMMKAWENLY
jgi:murein L,D-transpeptidase YcbB/YkuD